MWGDLVGNSLLTDEGFKRLASDLASGLISFDQVRSAGLEDEIRRYLDDDMYSAFLDESCSTCPYCEKIYADNRLHETICLNKSCPVWLNGHPQDVGKKFEKSTVAEWREKAKKRIEEDMKNPCAGCKFRKYHDWTEPTWTGFSQHYYDCEKPGCPMWSRLWWRNNDRQEERFSAYTSQLDMFRLMDNLMGGKKCGARMKTARIKPEDLPIPELD